MEKINLLLSSLSPETLALLQPRLEEVALPTRTKLYNSGEVPRYAYFLTSGIASVVSTMEDGASAEGARALCKGCTCWETHLCRCTA